jgi:tRNA modification GTPase
MTFALDDTIAAIASAPGGAARGIVRISGPRVIELLLGCFRPLAGDDWTTSRRAVAMDGQFDVGPTVGTLPCDLYLWPTNRSFTGQPSAELHTIGSPPLLDAVLAAVLASGARLAQPGEFTLRAFLAGRIDLTQAEAVLAVVDAHTGADLAVALSQLAGGMAGPLHRLREELLDALAQLEAGLDFADEDIDFISPAELSRQLQSAAVCVARLVAQLDARSETSVADRVVLIGRPNVGKSSLFNALLGDLAAITSDVAGTTRDFVSRRANWHGVDVELIDTAGADVATDGTHNVRRGGSENRATDDVATAAQSAASQQSASAALALLCLDATRPLDDWERRELARRDPRHLPVLTKIDVMSRHATPEIPAKAIATSALTGAGLDALRRAIADRLQSAGPSESGMVPSTAARCADSLREACETLSRAVQAAQTNQGDEIIAAEIRWALDAIGRVTGSVSTDDVLDRIFSRFCIGK